MARRKGKRGNLYSKVNSEQVSVLRIYKTDISGVSEGLNTWGKILRAAGLLTIGSADATDTTGFYANYTTGKEVDVRLIAVSFSGTNGQAASIEYPHDGTTYQIANTDKSARVKVPEKDYVDGQWVHQAGGTKITTSGSAGHSYGNAPVLRAISPMGYDQVLFTVTNGSVDFVDIAVRF